jgi:hypothetical protein
MHMHAGPRHMHAGPRAGVVFNPGKKFGNQILLDCTGLEENPIRNVAQIF